MANRENSYWDHCGRFQNVAEKLQELIPFQGEVGGGRKNERLEEFRKAQNQYYDLYNNGLCNRHHGFKQRFGVAPYQALRYMDHPVHSIINKKMDQIIIMAAAEQGLLDMIIENPAEVKAKPEELMSPSRAA
tara:strand:- start:191 stop:586 length:396 start_codon:yes stop_codon:yes gene_type:complete